MRICCTNIWYRLGWPINLVLSFIMRFSEKTEFRNVLNILCLVTMWTVWFNFTEFLFHLIKQKFTNILQTICFVIEFPVFSPQFEIMPYSRTLVLFYRTSSSLSKMRWIFSLFIVDSSVLAANWILGCRTLYQLRYTAC